MWRLKAPKNKHESIDLFSRGCYGNNIPTYANPSAALNTDEPFFVIRYKGEPGVQGPAIYGIARNCLISEWQRLIREGWKEERLYVNTEIPNKRIVFQGELSTGNWADTQWYLVGCEEPGMHMREAMKRSTFKATGWKARAYLQTKMDPASWDDLNAVINTWPDGVIELVIFDTPFGSLASTGRNCVVWEVRDGY